MLTAHTSNLLILGLSDFDIDSLREGKTTVFEGAPLGLPTVKVVVMHGETERDIERRLTDAGLGVA